MGADDAATAVGPELKSAEALASGAVAGWLAGTRANEFEEKDSDKEPSKSISTADVAGAGTFVVGAAVKRLG